MITKMTKYTLLSLRSDSDSLMQALQELGVMDITRSHKSIDEHSAKLLEEAAVYSDLIAGTALKTELAAAKSALAELEREKTSSSRWGSFDSSVLSALDKEGICLNFYDIPEGKWSDSWTDEFPVEKINCEESRVLAVCVNNDSQLPFAQYHVPTPRSQEKIDADITVASQRLGAVQSSLDELPEKAVGYNNEREAILSRLDLYLAGKASILEDENEESGDLGSFLDVYVGYAPSDEDAAVASALDEMDVYYIAEAASADDAQTPIKLRNNWFTRQFEVFTGMYGMPDYNEFDPTPVLAPFFLLFFSMCMGDAGYGLMLMAISVFLGKKIPQSGLGKLHNLIMLLGIGTFVVGVFLGTFFGMSLFDAAWVPAWLKKCMLVEGNIGQIAGFDPQMVLALGIGVFHICLAMVIKTACVTCKNGFRNNLSTWGWTLLVVGGVIVAALAVGGLLGGNALRLTVIILGAVSALGIFLFNTPGRNPLKNVGTGLWETYNMVTGLLGDTLSYLRLYALGLAGGMLGGAFNNLATMVLGEAPTWQWAPFIIIAVIGHALNLAMSCLGAFVHPLRLSFVEYFKNSGYEGTGKRYQPLNKNTNN